MKSKKNLSLIAMMVPLLELARCGCGGSNTPPITLITNPDNGTMCSAISDVDAFTEGHTKAVYFSSSLTWYEDSTRKTPIAYSRNDVGTSTVWGTVSCAIQDKAAHGG